MKNYNTNYVYGQVNSNQIYSDPTYQRAVDYNRVRKIVSNFNPALVNPIKVSLRDDGKYWVFDGQHTLAALKARNGNKHLHVECKIYTGLTRQEEAKLFAEQNGAAKAVKTIARMKALYTADDIDITELYKTVNGLGIRFDFTESKSPNKIVACATLYKIFKKLERNEFCDVLEIIKDAWGGIPESFNKEILSGMCVFYVTYRGSLSKEKAVKQFKKVSPQEIIREGKLYKYGGDSRFAGQLLIAYNKNLRTGKLDERLLNL